MSTRSLVRSLGVRQLENFFFDELFAKRCLEELEAPAFRNEKRGESYSSCVEGLSCFLRAMNWFEPVSEARLATDSGTLSVEL